MPFASSLSGTLPWDVVSGSVRCAQPKSSPSQLRLVTGARLIGCGSRVSFLSRSRVDGVDRTHPERFEGAPGEPTHDVARCAQTMRARARAREASAEPLDRESTASIIVPGHEVVSSRCHRQRRSMPQVDAGCGTAKIPRLAAELELEPKNPATRARKPLLQDPPARPTSAGVQRDGRGVGVSLTCRPPPSAARLSPQPRPPLWVRQLLRRGPGLAVRRKDAR